MRSCVRTVYRIGVFGLFSALAACHSQDEVSSTNSWLASSEFVRETDAWHTERMERLTSPHGWLSLVALAPLNHGVNRVGRSPEADVVYEGFPADHVGSFVVDGERIRFVPVDGVRVGGVAGDGVVRTDRDGEPTALSIGDIRLYAIVRGGRPMVRIKDASASTRVNFEGIERYPADASWRITAEFVPAASGQFIGVDTVIGVREEGAITGRARFRHGGVDVDAVLLDAGDGGGSLLRFGDATNGKGTYMIGRYLYVEPSGDGKTVVLDFNRAYNPPCAFTPFATCTIQPESNEFSFPVNAGERWAKGD